MMPDMPQDDEAKEGQEMDMIKTTLQKLIDQMNSMESDRIAPPAPEAAPDMSKAPGLFLGAGIEDPNENKAESYSQAEPETQENQHEPLDEHVLAELLDKADHADDEGGTYDDHLDEFDPDVAAMIRKKKKS